MAPLTCSLALARGPCVVEIKALAAEGRSCKDLLQWQNTLVVYVDKRACHSPNCVSKICAFHYTQMPQ